ncbi:uncharacterized protein LODBEIA_P12520 [Lodderomyces beijingensis]|uniref:Phosphotransferase n=1 Tax=Lodderomyces beijingensis TaxID=1775926 RepID=A0ABP0ZFT6_9ASCO
MVDHPTVVLQENQDDLVHIAAPFKLPHTHTSTILLEEDYKSVASTADSSPLSSPQATPISSHDSGDYTPSHQQKQQQLLLETIISSFTKPLSHENLSRHSQLSLEDFKTSLAENGLSMLPNYSICPTGEESGSYLVIDLGGSTLRIGIVDISPDLKLARNKRVKVLVEDKWIISNEYKNIDFAFFKFIGSKIMDILSRQTSIDLSSLIKVGITWSFPLETTNYNNGNILHVSKGYTVDAEVHGKDLKFLLESTLWNEFHVKIDVRSILNDSLAVYSAGSFLDDKMKLAMVLGTGFNMCCSLQANSETMHESKLIDEKILFNTELSLFGQHLCQDFTTKYDAVIDARLQFAKKHNFRSYSTLDPTDNSVFQPYELMTSGRYLPELCRLVVADLYNGGEIFANFSQEEMVKILTLPYDGFEGEIMCFVDESKDLEAIGDKIRQYYGWSKSIAHSDVEKLKSITSSVIKRAAFFVANAILSFIQLLQEYNKQDNFQGMLTIGYVGSVLTYFHNYRNLVTSYVNSSKEAKTSGYEIQLKLIDNSSIIGAAIGAAYYS